jgi:acyl-CoA thioesterase
MASLLCIADVLPPAALPLFKRMGPVSSMTWIFNVLSDNPRTDDGWWHIETDLTAARNGYSSQIMRIWSTRGELVVEGVQSVAIFI